VDVTIVLLSRVSIASCIVAFGITTAAAQERAAASQSHVRPEEPQLRAAVSVGIDVSPTFRALVERIESSDIVVYISSHLMTTPRVAGQSTFLSAGGGRRYLHVAVDSRTTGPDLVGLLAHELHHITEIAGEPSVVDARSLATFYRRIGFSVSIEASRFETAAAIATGRRVMRDALRHASDVGATSLQFNANTNR
jgi:hypothetical protein